MTSVGVVNKVVFERKKNVKLLHVMVMCHFLTGKQQKVRNGRQTHQRAGRMILTMPCDKVFDYS